MYGGHDSALNSCEIVQGLSHGSKAVGGAGSCGNHSVLNLQGVMVHVINDGRKIISCRCGNNNLAGTGGNMCGCLVLGGVETGTLQNYVNLQLSPRKVLCVCLLVDGDGLAVHGDVVLACANGIGILILALGRVILQQMRQHLGAGQIVDCHYLIPLGVEHLPEGQTADTAKTINCNSYCHFRFLLKYFYMF